MPALAIEAGGNCVATFAVRALVTFLVPLVDFFVVDFFTVALVAFLVAGLPAVFVLRAILGTPMGLKMCRFSRAVMYRKGLLSSLLD